MTTAHIHLLPPAVADAIAAGEVVERPASVVKELCENAVDAGAARVDVEVDGGGTVRIRVSDDGSGIAAADLPLAVARHATSKIETVDDPWQVHSLGFRGEALASIAAVADVLIVSRPIDAATGAQLRCRAAEVVEASASATAPGTSVEVRDLFFTTPARLRFLRSPGTEARNCTSAVADLALAHPEVAFSCRIDGRITLRAPGSGVLRDALRAVLGPAATAQLIDVASTGELCVTGAISEPRAHRARRGMVLVVNRRRVHNRSLLVSVEEAYRGLLPGDRYAYGVVAVDVDPATVDVNVHPTKREVRFRDEGRVFAAVQRACWAALQQVRPTSVWMAWDGGQAIPSASLTLRDRADPDAAAVDGATLDVIGVSDSASFGSNADDVAVPTHRGPAVETGDDDALPGLAALRPLQALGQARSAWIIAESPRGVVLVDPHAAHEKILYAELLATWGAAGGVGGRGREAGASQLLLIPAVVECDPTQLTRFETHAEFIARCGFVLDVFGPNLLRCSAVPAAARAGDAVRLVHELLDALDERDDRPASQQQHRVAALVACHSAVRLGDPLDIAEQQRLLDRLVDSPGGTTCPHGRPTVLVLDDDALRRAFRRPAVPAPVPVSAADVPRVL